MTSRALLQLLSLSVCVLFYSSALHRAAGRRGFMIDLQRCAGGWRGFVIDVQSAEEQPEEERRGAQRNADRRRAHYKVASNGSLGCGRWR